MDNPLEDVNVDITALFMYYNALYFDSSLGACSVQWSSGRMTSCGGTCQMGGGGCLIRLSEPLLKLRPIRDLKMVLLHEMIHAYLYLNKIKDDGVNGHGTQFQAVMNRINASTKMDPERPFAGYNITTTHSMIDEVRHYQVHWWECEKCKHIIKRSMNRKPQPADCLSHKGDACTHPKCGYHTHQKACGGAYSKIRSPLPKEKEKNPRAPRKASAAGAAAGASGTLGRKGMVKSSGAGKGTSAGTGGGSAVAAGAVAGGIVGLGRKSKSVARGAAAGLSGAAGGAASALIDAAAGGVGAVGSGSGVAAANEPSDGVMVAWWKTKPKEAAGPANKPNSNSGKAANSSRSMKRPSTGTADQLLGADGSKRPKPTSSQPEGPHALEDDSITAGDGLSVRSVHTNPQHPQQLSQQQPAAVQAFAGRGNILGGASGFLSNTKGSGPPSPARHTVGLNSLPPAAPACLQMRGTASNSIDIIEITDSQEDETFSPTAFMTAASAERSRVAASAVRNNQLPLQSESQQGAMVGDSLQLSEARNIPKAEAAAAVAAAPAKTQVRSRCMEAALVRMQRQEQLHRGGVPVNTKSWASAAGSATEGLNGASRASLLSAGHSSNNRQGVSVWGVEGSMEPAPAAAAGGSHVDRLDDQGAHVRVPSGVPPLPHLDSRQAAVANPSASHTVLAAGLKAAAQQPAAEHSGVRLPGAGAVEIEVEVLDLLSEDDEDPTWESDEEEAELASADLNQVNDGRDAEALLDAGLEKEQPEGEHGQEHHARQQRGTMEPGAECTLGVSRTRAPVTFTCPVCCAQWEAGSMAEAYLDAHVTACVARM